MRKKLAVIIVNYNSDNDTIECLESFLEKESDGFIFIVDNNSNNEMATLKNWAKKYLSLMKIDFKFFTERDFLKTNIYYKQVNFVELDKNYGFAKANNFVIEQLLKHGFSGYVMLLNPDVVVERDFMQKLKEQFPLERRKIYGFKILNYFDHKNIVFLGGFKIRRFMHGVVPIKKEEDLFELDSISGAALLTHIDTFREVGPLPEEYFLYWEEADFCWKAKLRGYKFEVLDLVIFDKIASSIGKKSFLRQYLYIKNGVKFYFKYLKFNIPFIYMSLFGKLFFYLVKRNFLLFKSTFKGLIDGTKEIFCRFI